MEFTVLDKDFTAVGLLDVFESAIWTERYDLCGDFEIYTPASIEVKELLAQERYLVNYESNTVMIIESHEINTDVENGNHIIVKGRSLESILDRRIIYPQVVIYGNLQNGIKTLLDQNAINPTDPNRKISNLIFSPSEDPRILEMTIEGQYYGENLYDTISLICMEKQIGFMITLNEQFQFVFSLYMGQDRSYEQFDNPYIIFSPMFNNIISSNYINSLKPVKNVAYVGGEGEGSDRVFVTVGDNTNLARKEIFVDAKSLSSKYEGGTMPPEEYQKQLVQRGNEELANHVADMMFDGEVAEYFMYLYGRDYQMGDIVQLENEYGMEARSRVTEVIKSQNVSDGINIFPTFTKVN